MDANIRIQWLHKKILLKSYPNAHRLAERFKISPRQAQRDIDYLRKKLNAPLEYDTSKRGFFYKEDFTLPILLTSDNDEFYIPEVFNASRRELAADESIIQMAIPYTATIEIPNKLAAMEMSAYIVGHAPHSRYVCEFHSVEKFLGVLLSMDSDFRIVEPIWLQERILHNAKRILNNHSKKI